jgi:deoxyribonucleoside regulator
VSERPENHDKTREALRASRMYYEQGSSMEEIAAELRTSRSTVSRLLSHARETGMVEIRINPLHSQVEDLKELISAHYGVWADVIYVPRSAMPTDRVERTAAQAAELLAETFGSDMILGLSWGTMVNAISRVLVPKATVNTQIVLLNGTGNPRTMGAHYSGTMLATYADAFGSYAQQLPLPLFFDRAETREAMFQERSIQRVVELQASADVTLFSVGTVTDGVPSSPYLSGYFLDPSDFSALRDDGAVGDVATRFIAEDGSHAGIRLNARTSGAAPGDLKRAKFRICAVSGDHKIEALHAALVGGFVTHLVIDELTAQSLITRYRLDRTT